MRVLHVMESTIGGTRRHLVDVALGQAAAGLDVHVTASCERHAEFREDLERLARAGVDVHELPMVRSIRPATDWGHARALARRIESLRPHVVHTHSSKAGVLGRFAALRAGRGARVHTPHTFAFLFANMFSARQRRLYRAIETWFARRTDLIVAVGHGEARTMLASGVVAQERIRVVPNGIQPEAFASAAPLPRAELCPQGADRGHLVAGVVGLLNVAKGQDLAVRALAERGCERVDLVLVGHGEMDAELRALARDLGVHERVAFLGWRRDVPRILRTLDVLLLPSRWEGLPYVVLEAMAAGTPVVAARVDGALELVRDGETGFTFPIESVAGLAEALGHLARLTPAERARLGSAGRGELERAHTRETMVAGLVAVYEEAVALAGRRARA
jgi:glycosyltransferase involved in cell wall biosynthesis